MKFINLYNLILEELTDKQKKLTDKYTAKRKEGLSFGPLFKEERTYFPLNITEIMNIEIPNEIEQTLDNAGFYITDYRAGIAMKKAKPGEEKDLRQIKIGKILSKLNQPNLLKQFNERLGTSKKDIKNLKVDICITYNPYDIAGMSTDRNWTSCMNLDDGAYNDTPLKQVQYGGMVAYLISDDDKNIEKPLARIAIKRFISKNDSSKFIFLAEYRIYGDVELANELRFQEKLIEILEKSNKLTTKNSSGEYLRDDENSYSDTYYKNYYWFNDKNLNNLDKDIIIKNLKQNICEHIPISCKLLKYAIKNFKKEILNILDYSSEFLICYDIDKELIELLLKNNIVLATFQEIKNLTNTDVYNLIFKYKDSEDIIRDLIIKFIKNKYIKFTEKTLDLILKILCNIKYTIKYTIKLLFFKYKLNEELLKKYLSIIFEKEKSLVTKDESDFLCSQNFPIDIMIKYCNKSTLNFIYNNNNNLSKENKEKLKKYLNI